MEEGKGEHPPLDEATIRRIRVMTEEERRRSKDREARNRDDGSRD